MAEPRTGDPELGGYRPLRVNKEAKEITISAYEHLLLTLEVVKYRLELSESQVGKDISAMVAYIIEDLIDRTDAAIQLVEIESTG